MRYYSTTMPRNRPFTFDRSLNREVYSSFARIILESDGASISSADEVPLISLDRPVNSIFIHYPRSFERNPF